MKKIILQTITALSFSAITLFGQSSLITLSNGATITVDGSDVVVCADGGTDDNSGNNFIELNGGTFCFSPQPVTLVAFSAALVDGTVLLNWNTATELANYGFEIERASSRQVGTTPVKTEWEKIGFVEGHGNSTSPQDYSYTDSNPPSGRVEYRLKQIDIDGGSQYYYADAVEVETPKVFKLTQNYPNPFNPTTTITYSIPKASDVTLKVYNAIGENVVTLVNQHKEAGKFNVTFNASNLPSGVYFYSIKAGNYSSVKKMILMK